MDSICQLKLNQDADLRDRVAPKKRQLDWWFRKEPICDMIAIHV